jgi:hypothetical protein
VVAVARWDDQFAPFRNGNMFLKIGTRGYERSILEGACEALSQIIGVQSDPRSCICTGRVGRSATRPWRCGLVLARLSPVNCLQDDLASGIEIDGDLPPSKRRRMNRAK